MCCDHVFWWNVCNRVLRRAVVYVAFCVLGFARCVVCLVLSVVLSLRCVLCYVL